VCCLYCAVLRCAVQLPLPLCEPLIVCCAFLSPSLLSGGHLRVFDPLALPCLATPTSHCLHLSRQLHLNFASGQRSRAARRLPPAFQSHRPARPTTWANLEGSAIFSIRVEVAIHNSMSSVAVPSVHTRRTAGSITPGGVEHIHTQPTSENETGTTWCIISCIASY